MKPQRPIGGSLRRRGRVSDRNEGPPCFPRRRPFMAWLALGLFLVPCLQAANSEPLPENPRLISLNPSLTAIVVALGRGDTLVGVDDYSAQVVSEVSALPKVGGLFDPSLEAVVALRPDRVLMVAGVDQQSHGDRLERLGLSVEIYQNERLDEVLENINRIGGLLGRETEAAARVASIHAMRRAVHSATKGRPRPATLAVVDRSPLYLVGSDTFLDEMLEAAGAENLGRKLSTGYPRGSIEWLIAAKPDLLLDMTPGLDDARTFWGRWSSLPAVQSNRVLSIEASRVSLPGPELDQALRELAIVVHGPEIGVAIDRLLHRTTGLWVEPQGRRGRSRPSAPPAVSTSTQGQARRAETEPHAEVGAP